ncbi:MAG: sodium:solute symporter family transporter, partial [Myxococcota bacterium]
MTGTAEIEVSGWALGAFATYLLVVVGIGIWAARFSSAGTGEFFIGGRRMGRFVVAVSAVVSGRSAWLLLGVTGMAYTRGASAVWAMVGYVAVELLLFLTFAGRLRRFTEAKGCITLPDFFAERFDDRDGRLRVVLVAVILVFMVAYVSAQLVAGGKAFAGGFGMEPGVGIVVTAAIVLVYTALGGFLAVSITDCVQAVIMLAMLVVLPAVVLVDLGGAGRSLEMVRALDPALLDFTALGFGVLIGFLGIGLGSPGNPHIVARYMSIRDPGQLRWSAVIGTAWNVFLGAGALAVGLIGRAAYPDVEALPAADPESLFPFMARAYLP